MSTSWQDNERLVDLLVKEATEGLSANESAELAALARETPGVDRHAMQSIVAGLWTPPSSQREKMPAALRERILNATAGESQEHDNVTPFRSPREGRRGGFAGAGWWAAAASFILAVAGWWPRIVGDHAPPIIAEKSAEAAREELLSDGKAMQVALTAASDKPLTGDVVFDPVRQIGFLRFRGIPANDPRLEQYQLWIADAGRAQPEPVDGGVFDVSPQTTASGDVIVPFRAKLPVGKPAAFVVTMEQPGGVVVSKQERVMALAKVPAGT